MSKVNKNGIEYLARQIITKNKELKNQIKELRVRNNQLKKENKELRSKICQDLTDMK